MDREGWGKSVVKLYKNCITYANFHWVFIIVKSFTQDIISLIASIAFHKNYGNFPAIEQHDKRKKKLRE